MAVLRQPVAVELGSVPLRPREPPVLRADHPLQLGRGPLGRVLDLEHLAQRPRGERRLGERHGSTRIRRLRARATQRRPVRLRQVVARGEHALLVHDVGELAVLAREPERELELLPGELRVAVTQADREEVRVPLPESDVADLRGHDRPSALERGQLHDVRAEHPPAEGRHVPQILAHPRAAVEPRLPQRHERLFGRAVGADLLGGDRDRAIGGDLDADPGSDLVAGLAAARQREADRGGRIPADAERAQPVEGEGHGPERDPVRLHVDDREDPAGRVVHDERVEHAALIEPPLVLGRVHAHTLALAVAEHQQARARHRERGRRQVEVAARGERELGRGRDPAGRDGEIRHVNALRDPTQPCCSGSGAARSRKRSASAQSRSPRRP